PLESSVKSLINTYSKDDYSTPQYSMVQEEEQPSLKQKGFPLFITVEGLFWKPGLADLNYAILSETPSQFGSTKNAKIKSISPDWDWGLRAAMGYRFESLNSMLDLSWIYYENNTESNIHQTPGKVVYTMMSHPLFFFSSAKYAQGKWTLHFNQVDLEWKTTLYNSRWLALSLGVGLRGLFENESCRIYYKDIFFGAPSVSFDKIQLHTSFSGVGPKGCLSIVYSIFKGVSISGLLGLSQCWGIFHMSNKEKFILANTVLIEGVNAKKSEHDTVPVMDLGLHLAWSIKMNGFLKEIKLSAGYETHYFWSISRFFNFINNFDQGIINNDNRSVSLNGWDFGLSIFF
ncbi:MAG: hypothetical protein KDK59_07845, partial [Simkania sp.]|nr:hypothetical protein [Simkania sp.]